MGKETTNELDVHHNTNKDPVVVSNLHHITFFCVCYCMSFSVGTMHVGVFSYPAYLHLL